MMDKKTYEYMKERTKEYESLECRIRNLNKMLESLRNKSDSRINGITPYHKDDVVHICEALIPIIQERINDIEAHKEEI